MSLKFHCPHCERSLNAPEKLAGRQAKCPNCGNLVAIPNLPPELPTDLPTVAPQIQSLLTPARPAAERPPVEAFPQPAPVPSSADDMSFDDDMYKLAPPEAPAHPAFPMPLPPRPATTASQAATNAIDPPFQFSPKPNSDDSLNSIRDQLHWIFL